MVNKRIDCLTPNRFLLLAALLLNGCASHTPMAFYMLDAEAEAGQAESASALPQNLAVGLGPVHLPEYLNRPQIVVEISENQYRLDEHNRWAERLDENIARTLSRQLAARLGLAYIIRYPWPYRQPMDYQIGMDILLFHQGADGYSHLQTQWQIRRQEQNLLSRQFTCSLPAGDNVNDRVKVQSVCVARLGLEIENGLRELVLKAGN
ncbi:MAG: PqiC family protein [Methylococcales bacterium]|nr:PqiC family protein [Methylococcales bacterium]